MRLGGDLKRRVDDRARRLAAALDEEMNPVALGSFPVDPARRRAVLVLDRHDMERCAYEPDAGRALLDEEAHVLVFPVTATNDAPHALQNIVDAGLARPGSVLAQNPYDLDRYEDAALASQRFALSKHLAFSAFCMRLGAKEVVVNQIDVRTRSGKSTFSASGERLGGSAAVDVEQEAFEKFRAQMTVRHEFAGGAANIAEAERFLRSSRLLGDQTMRSLLDMRRQDGNELRTLGLKLQLSSEAKSNLNVVARLKIPAFVKISTEYDRVVREHSEYDLAVTVRF